jgi:DNA-binding CsgD family transcriptional regulator/tetratricopeptide (TPR) repeat protein
MLENAASTKTVDPTFVGRDQALEVFARTLERAVAGQRQLLTVAGEPGIGKTRSAEVFAKLAEEQGALVLWGRCYEEPGAPPYWPWVQALREYMQASSPSELQLALGRGGPEIATLVPEISGDVAEPAAPSTLPLELDRMRFRVFDAISQFFGRATQQVPILLVLDNLHWADAPSLSLLEFVSKELQRSRLLIVGTYRDNEVSRKSPLLRTLGGLGQDAGVERLRLGGLSENAIASLATQLVGAPLPASAVRAIHEQTDGNPLFVIEIIKVLLEESRAAGAEPIAVRIPDGIREAIGRRLTRLSNAANNLLAIASVIGREFDAGELAAVAERDVGEVLEDLGVATTAGIVERRMGTRGDYRFTHSLIRETLYDEIPTVDRLRLHGRVADVLVATRARYPESSLSRIAHHYYETAALGGTHKAVEYATRAADYALRVHAYEEALAHYDQLISLLSTETVGHDERLAEVLFRKGLMLCHLGNEQGSTETLLKATSLVRTLGNAELLVDVAAQLVLITSYAPQGHVVPLLEKAIALLPEGDSRAAAKAHAAQAYALRTVGQRQRALELVDRAVAMAERLGDGATSTYCLTAAVMALRGEPDSLAKRIALGKRNIEVAREVGRPEAGLALAWYGQDLLEAGRIDEAADVTEQAYEQSANRYLLIEYYASTMRVMMALLRGEWEGLEQRIEELRERGNKTRPDDAEGVYGVQMFQLNRELGKLAELAPIVRVIADKRSPRSWKPGLMLMCAEIGLREHAASLFEELAADRFARLKRDDMFVPNLVYYTETCCALDRPAEARALYELLSPYADQTANHPRAVCFGSTQLFLARLSVTAGEHERAREHFALAAQRNRLLGAWPALARTLYHQGAHLQASDPRGAQMLLGEAEQIAARLGMAGLCRDIAPLVRVGAARDYPDDLTAREVDVLRLIAIGRSNKDIAAVLAISLNTVATHVRSILNKTGCANRTESAAYALRQDLLESPRPIRSREVES